MLLLGRKVIEFHKRYRCVKVGTCIEWTAQLTPKGYGAVSYKGKRWIAHRLVAHLAGKPIEDAQCVMHTCDNRKCVNPLHLRLGSMADNNRDRAAKGRSAVGERSGTHKLSEKDVLAIRKAYRAGNGVVLAARYGISSQMVYDIVRGKWWKHLPLGKERPTSLCGKQCATRSKLSRTQVRYIRNQRAKGVKLLTLAHKFNLSVGNVSLIANRKIYKFYE